MNPPPPTSPSRHAAAAPPRKRRRLVTLAAVALVLGCLALLVVGVARTHWAEELVRVYAERIASEALESRVTIGAVSIDPFGVGVVLGDVEVTPPSGGRLLKLAEARVNLAGFQTLGEVLRGRVHLDAIELRRPEVSLEIVDGEIANLPPPIKRAMKEPGKEERGAIELPARIDLLVVHEGIVRASVPGTLLAEVAAIEIRAVGHPDGKGFEARLHCSAGGLEMARLHEPLRDLTLEAKLRLDPLSAEVAVLRVSTPRVALNVAGKASLDDEGRPALDGRVTLSLPLEIASEVRPDLPALSGHVSVDATASGTLADLKARATLELVDVKADAYSLPEARVTAVLQDNGIKLEEARVKVGKSGWGAVTGFLELGGTFPFRGDATAEELEVGFVAAAVGQPDIPVEVVGGGKATFSGELRGPSGFHLEAEGSATASDLHVAMGPHATGPRVVSLSDIHGSSKLRITDHLELYESRATRGSVTVNGGMHLWPTRKTMDIHATASGDARDAGPIAGRLFGGRGGGEVRVWGPLGDPEVKASGAFTGVTTEGRPVGDVTGEMHYGTKVVTMTKLRVVRGAGRIDIPKLVYDMRDPRGERITADLAVENARIEELAQIAGLEAAVARVGLTGGVSGWAHVEGPVALPDLQAGLALDEWTLLGERFGAASVEGTLLGGVLDVARAEVTKGTGTIGGRGRLEKDGRLDFDVEVNGLKLADVDAPVVRALGLPGAVSGSMRVGGTTAAPALAGDARLALDRGGAVAVSGRVDTAGAGTFDATVRANDVAIHEVLEAALAAGDPERAAALKLPKIDGALTVTGTARGTFERFAVEGDASARLAGGGTVSARGRVDADPNVRLGLEVEGNGVPLLVALRTALAAADPASGAWKGLPETTATVALDGKLAGPVEAPAFEGNVDVDFGEDGRAGASGRIDPAGDLDLDLRTSGLSLDRAVRLAVGLLEPARAPELLGKLPALGGQVDAKGHLSGTTAAPRLDAHADARGLAVAGTGIGEASLDATLREGDVLSVTGTALGGSSVAFRATLHGNLPFEASAKFPATDLLTFATSARDVLPGLTVFAEGDASFSGELVNPEAIRGRAGLTRFEVATPNMTIGAAERLALSFDKGRLDVKATPFAAIERGGATSAFLVGGSWDVDGEMNFDIDGDISLGVVAALVPGGVIEGATGTIEGLSAKVRGTPESPFMNGRGHVAGSRFGLSFFPEALTDFTGEVSLTGSQIELSEVTGSVGTGIVRVNGTIDLEKTTDPAFDLMVDVRETTTRFIDEWPATVDGWITVKGTPRSLVLSGSLEVLEARYTTDVDWKPNLADVLAAGAKRISGRAAPRPISVGDKTSPSDSGFLQLDLELHADGGIYVNNNLAELEAYIDSTVEPLRVLGTDRNPYIDGLARAKPGGIVKLFDREFEIVRGEVRFDDKYRIDPRFDIEAVATINDYTVTVLAHGTADTLALELKSDPILPPDDIALLITLGVSRKDFEGEGIGGTALGVGLAASGLDEKVLKPVEDVIPLDFTAGTRLSEKSGTYVPIIGASKRLTPRLRLRGSTSLVDPTGDLEAGAELKLDKGWSVHGTYEVESATGFGDLGLDLKWKKKF